MHACDKRLLTVSWTVGLHSVRVQRGDECSWLSMRRAAAAAAAAAARNSSSPSSSPSAPTDFTTQLVDALSLAAILY